MCGIFGLISKQDSPYTEKELLHSFTTIAKLSETRGKDSSGICTFNQKRDQIELIKGPVPIRFLLKQTNTKLILKSSFLKNRKVNYAFGHSRLVTNGSQLDDKNNQPVVKDEIIGVHNGIIVNADELWANNEAFAREYEIDTEILLALLNNSLNISIPLEKSIFDIFKLTEGTVATGLLFKRLNKFVLATNNGSLYVITNNKDILLFASERIMLSKLKNKISLFRNNNFKINVVKPYEGLTIDLDIFTIKKFSEKSKLLKSSQKNHRVAYPLNEINVKSPKNQLNTVIDLNSIHLGKNYDSEVDLLKYPEEEIKCLARCNNCVLPETFPFIEFDSNGVCNYCNNYIKQNQISSLDELERIVSPYKSNNNSNDVLLPLSGGRDSTYVVHVAKKKLGLNPITLTYDWGMVTDLARRNIARICGELGIENIIVAADMHWKRENIRKNIVAWLKNPELGMIPLFMAGDKFFFYYSYKIKKELGIDLELWGFNKLENTDFKVGFSGIPPRFDKKRIFSMSIFELTKLFLFVGKNVIQTPSYLNQSIFDSIGSIGSRYFTPKKHYYHLFDYTKWDEEKINNTIIEKYGWETCVDTNSTWRIGDGTASFYNYIYVLVAGFSENDTFRSNQIREGMITREEAINLIYEENRPRFNSIKWYLEILGLDFSHTIKQINKIRKIF